MAAFKDIKTPGEIQHYLLDILSRMSKNGEKYLYHYTSFEALSKIITSGYLWLGSSQNMNDYMEGEFIESVDGSNRVYFACFSRAEENLAMYKMYAPAPGGSMLIVPLEMAKQIIESLPDSKEFNKMVNVVRDNKLTKEQTPAFMHWSEVAYKDLHTDTLKTAGAQNTQIENPLNVKTLAGFVKLHGWEYEREVRLQAMVVKQLSEREKVALKLPEGFSKSIEIVTVPGFNKALHQIELSQLKRMGVKIHESEYDGLVDLGGSVAYEMNKKISELELENAALRKRIELTDNDITSDDHKKAEQYVEIKQTLEKELVDYSKIETDQDRKELAKAPWKKFPFNNIILKSVGAHNPTYNDGLIKAEPYDFYDDGFLVFAASGGGVVTIRKRTEDGKIVDSDKEVYIVEAIPFSRIYKLDINGSKNYPYPTLFCRFENGNPFEEEWYIDKQTGIRYTQDQIVNKDWEAVFEDGTGYVPTPIISTDRKNISLFACIMALFAAENDGRIMVIPSLSETSYIAGRRNVERNQSPRELARWDDGVSQLLGQGYIKLIGKKDKIYSLTADGYNLAERFKEQCNIDPQKSSGEILSDFGVPD